MERIWELAIATCGIAAIGAMTFLALYKQWLRLGIFSTLTRRQTFILMLVFLLSTLLFGTSAIVAYVTIRDNTDTNIGVRDLPPSIFSIHDDDTSIDTEYNTDSTMKDSDSATNAILPEQIIDLSSVVQSQGTRPHTSEHVLLVVVFTTTGERVIVRLPIDIQAEMAATLIYEHVYFGDENPANWFIYNGSLIIKQHLYKDETLRDIGLKDGDEVRVKVHLEPNVSLHG